MRAGFPRRNIRVGAPALALVFALSCGDDTVGNSGASGTGTSGGGTTAATVGTATGATSTTVGTGADTSSSGGSPGDPALFPVPSCIEGGTCCTEDKDCCEAVQVMLPSIACPGSAYPYNWTCVLGNCVQPGCVQDSDCSELFTGLTCMQVNHVGQCVAACSSDGDCTDDAAMPGTTCSGVSDQAESFCLQPPDP